MAYSVRQMYPYIVPVYRLTKYSTRLDPLAPQAHTRLIWLNILPDFSINLPITNHQLNSFLIYRFFISISFCFYKLIQRPNPYRLSHTNAIISSIDPYYPNNMKNSERDMSEKNTNGESRRMELSLAAQTRPDFTLPLILHSFGSRYLIDHSQFHMPSIHLLSD
ncbi:uncharacterized protein BDR25DRAFT_350107 [Lindgomyces ingoldianus]|uniref:Uncharacterized protein n=1 Tax=Lindgomyces ingoldianus TaxID=673940 RepID=A0ACB6RAS3_9PLEO|nr:uncharacterized protein BDR25DRAFT_350107 [Lindgomyces ingoldianus]KAF2475825.1 hypothetical protein BDR25DRAFT_350107 [Lindgomyces ingoldianus]